MMAWYANRGGYLMAIGRPAAQVGLYHPGNSIWMGDQEADRSTTKLGWQLFEHQVEWDYFDQGDGGLDLERFGARGPKACDRPALCDAAA